MINGADDESGEIRFCAYVVVGDHEVGGRYIDQRRQLRYGFAIKRERQPPGIKGAGRPEQQCGKFIGECIYPEQLETERRHPKGEMWLVEPVVTIDIKIDKITRSGHRLGDRGIERAVGFQDGDKQTAGIYKDGRNEEWDKPFLKPGFPFGMMRIDHRGRSAVSGCHDGKYIKPCLSPPTF